MVLERITKETFDTMYRDGVDNLETSLYEELKKQKPNYDLIHKLTDQYISLLDFRREYIGVKHNYHIAYYINGNTITYAKNGKIIRGFNYKK